MDEQQQPLALTERQRFWLEHIACADAAGISTKNYAVDHGLSVQAMYSARKALVERGALKPGGRGIRTAPSPRFARVVPAVSSATKQTRETPVALTVQLQLPNGTVVGFPGPLDEAGLRLVLQTAAALP